MTAFQHSAPMGLHAVQGRRVGQFFGMARTKIAEKGSLFLIHQIYLVYWKKKK